MNDVAAAPSSAASSKLGRAWRWLPVWVRAVTLAFSVLIVGQMPPGVFLLLGLRLTPTLPWFPLATAIWLVAFWMWIDGRGWPRGTGARRGELLRAHRLPARTWGWTLLAGALGMICVLCGALLTGLIAPLPPAAYEPPFDVSPYPWWTLLALFFQLALVAAVVEEAAFRGYMLSLLEARYGWVVGIFATAALFYLVHLSHAYATWAFLPFFAAYSLLHGLLVYFSRSILPSVVLHGLGDFTILPMQYGVIADPLGDSIGAHVGVVVGSGLAAVLALHQLAKRVVVRRASS